MLILFNLASAAITGIVLDFTVITYLNYNSYNFTDKT